MNLEELSPERREALEFWRNYTPRRVLPRQYDEPDE